MMGRLNIASYGLLVGAMGQYWFYGRLFPNVPPWFVLFVLFLLFLCPPLCPVTLARDHQHLRPVS